MIFTLMASYSTWVLARNGLLGFDLLDDLQVRNLPIWQVNFADVSTPKKNVAKLDNEWLPVSRGPIKSA